MSPEKSGKGLSPLAREAAWRNVSVQLIHMVGDALRSWSRSRRRGDKKIHSPQGLECALRLQSREKHDLGRHHSRGRKLCALIIQQAGLMITPGSCMPLTLESFVSKGEKTLRFCLGKTELDKRNVSKP